jgi:hypothetical protein
MGILWVGHSFYSGSFCTGIKRLKDWEVSVMSRLRSKQEKWLNGGALAVVVIDDFKNRVIEGDEVSLLMDGEQPELIKKNNWRIFKTPQPGMHKLLVEGRRFQKQAMEIDTDEEKTVGGGIMKVRLLPNSTYPLGEEVKVIRGQAEPECELHFTFINEKESYRLEADYQSGGMEIGIDHRGEGFLDGALFCLQTADGELEEFWIEEQLDEEKGRYRLRYALKEDYESGKCILRRVYPVTTDRVGDFYLPVPVGEEGSEEYRY